MKSLSLKALMSALLILLTTIAVGQPGNFGGQGGFGGRPPRNPGERPEGFAPRGQTTNQNSTIRQKKKVREGSTFKVVGTLCDSVTGEVLPFVNVSILDSVDGSNVKGGTTNFDGNFELTGIPQGGMQLRISAIGYQNRLISFHVYNNTTLGTIKLKPGSTTLKEVVITDQKPLYAMDGEKMIYNVSEDPSIQTGTTTDALQNAPGVEVDIEGNISLRGVSSVEIWINDKPSKLTEENLKTYLETLPANALERIEAITNPSAKYATDAEAVINIVTSANIKSNHFISFGVNGASQPSISPWLSYVWANEKLSINLHASGRYNYNENSSEQQSIARRHGATEDSYDTTTVTGDTTESTSKRYSGNFGFNINYQIDSMTDAGINGMINYSLSKSSSHGIQDFNQLLPNALSYIYHDTNDNDNTSLFGRFGADFTHKFDNEGHNIRVFLNGSFNSGDVDNYIIRDYTTDYSSLFGDENKHYTSTSKSNDISLNARYNRPYSLDGEMNYGVGVSHNNSQNVYDRMLIDPVTGLYSIVDNLRSYEYEGSNTRANADANWTHRFGGLTLQLGLGGRYDNIQFNYISNQAGFSDDTSYNFFTVTPSVHLSYRTKDMHNFKLNYTMRISNPGESQLTTFKKYGEQSYSTGNRNLNAARMHQAEAGWTKFFDRFGNVGIEAYGRFSPNEISNLTDATEVEDEYLKRIIQYSTPYNLGSSYRIGGTVHLTYRPSGFINIRMYGNLYDYGYRMERLDGTVLENNKLSYSLNINGWMKVMNKYQIHLTGRYTSPTIGLASESKARYAIDCGVRADFFKRKMSAFINIRDIFNWGATIGSGNKNTNPLYLTNATTKTLNSRYIGAGVTFRFGKMELEKKSGENGETATEE